VAAVAWVAVALEVVDIVVEEAFLMEEVPFEEA